MPSLSLIIASPKTTPRRLLCDVALPGQLEGARGCTFTFDNGDYDWGYTIDRPPKNIRLLPYSLEDGYAWSLLVMGSVSHLEHMWSKGLLNITRCPSSIECQSTAGVGKNILVSRASCTPLGGARLHTMMLVVGGLLSVPVSPSTVSVGSSGYLGGVVR